MKPGDNLFICTSHHIPLFYREDNCPWCAFIASVDAKLTSEYKRGFMDGLLAAAKTKEAKDAPVTEDK